MLYFVCVATGILIGYLFKREKKIDSSETLEEFITEQAQFVDPITTKEIFDKSNTIDDYVKNSTFR